MALVISRRDGESFTVGDATVTVKGRKNGKTYLTVDAPQTTRITRHPNTVRMASKEIIARIEAEDETR
jgi:sRNA-binding carbon storage regulator CsrA